jgi:hypothetical protein
MSHRGSEQQSQNSNIVDAMIMPYIVLQEAMTTAMKINCKEHTRLCKQQPTFSLMWINHIGNRKGVRHQQ